MARNTQQQQNRENDQQNPPSTTGENAPPTDSPSPADDARSSPAASAAPGSMGLDDSGSDGPATAARGPGLSAAPVIAPPAVATRRVDSGTPYCARHNVLMITASSQERAAYYRCPVPGCDQTDKRARPTTRIPKEPMRCPQRSCCAPASPGGEPRQPQYLEVDRDPRRSTAFQLRMVCPKCGFEVKVPRPGVEAAVERARREAGEDLSDR